MTRLNEQMLDNASIGGSPVFSGICCIALAVILVFVELFMYGTVSIYTIFMAVMIVGMGVMMIVMWYNRLNTIKNHIKRYEGKRVAIVKLCNELQEQTAGFFRILNELRKKKDLKFEIDDRTGELIVGKTIRSKTISVKEADGMNIEKISQNKCTHCGRVLNEDYEFCPGCGSKSFKE